ncbi:mitochondrial carrier [Exidia glandulosa HHB12029]|uniref:Mitochondrial carrier n=1 Tax=Exidia glandulosa HHB12029 TaxID=1314781 RepID=A0A165QLA1_EXIGL|nr:mitochondrial carrier [Exidia glandulosa HHB12029]
MSTTDPSSSKQTEKQDHARPPYSARATRRDYFESVGSGAYPAPFLPPLRADARPAIYDMPYVRARTLDEWRADEGEARREARLRAVWKQLPRPLRAPDAAERAREEEAERSESDLNPERARILKHAYEQELLRVVGRHSPDGIEWDDFLRYANKKEAELWHIFHDELDLDGNGHLDAEELRIALSKGGIKLSASTISDFMTFLASSSHSHSLSFPEFRDFLLLMPRTVNAGEIFRYYEVRKYNGDDGRGAARVNMEGDVSLSAEDRPPPPPKSLALHHDADDEDDFEDEEEAHEQQHHGNDIGSSMALKFLFAGGIAGAVSRTATAPFDRLKVFLITRPPDLGGTTVAEVSTKGTRALLGAARQIYVEAGIRGFWVGNGLNIIKIFPESAIKFFSYESSKRFFARHWDRVDDPSQISGTSRFMSGGFGGLTSQLAIYPIETVKTQMMSSTAGAGNLLPSMRRLWAIGGVRAFYTGLTIGLVGVFPYSAIDMSTFEALKLAHIRSTGQPEPSVLALLAYGSISGSVGATSVYPLNLVRTRLQASGSPGHPQLYTGIWDVVKRTYATDGWKGFYRGLVPTLAKVVPAVSISYVVYEHSKRRLGV